MHVRLKPFQPKKGQLLKRYTVFGIRFEGEKGWYTVDEDVAAYLKTVKQNNNDPDSKDAFDVCTQDEAMELDRQDRIDRMRRGESVMMPIATDARRETNKAMEQMSGKRASAAVVGHNIDVEPDDDDVFGDDEDLAPPTPDLTTADLQRPPPVRRSKPQMLSKPVPAKRPPAKKRAAPAKKAAKKKVAIKKKATKKKTSRRAATKRR